jgi:hypothetical protein
MATHKKQLPLVLLKALQPVINNNLTLIEPVISENLILDLRDKDEKSDFYFRLTDQKLQGNTLIFAVDFKPKDEVNVGNVLSWNAIDGVVVLLENWLKLIVSYNELETIYDDPILKTYIQEIEIELVIEDAESVTKPFSHHHQEIIYEFLHRAKEEINQFQELNQFVPSEEINQINEEIDDLQRNLTRRTKRQVFSQLVVILARAKKLSFTLGKELFIQVISNVISKFLLG